MDFATLQQSVKQLACEFAGDRDQRQRRRHLEKADFAALRDAGMPLIALPADRGGLWQSVAQSTEPICELLRSLAQGDPAVALVCAMHPAVLSYWLTMNAEMSREVRWQQQTERVFQSVHDGHWWGTITSEPGSGGDVLRTRTRAVPDDGALSYRISGQKHFGSGSGVTSFMVTSALPDGEEQADWFFLDVRDVAWDGSQGMRLLSEWDAHGMAATQSHAFEFQSFPATRIACTGQLPHISARTGGFIGCLFASVIVGMVDVAMGTAEQLQKARAAGQAGAYEQVEWAHARKEYWLICRAWEGLIRAAQRQPDSRHEVILGKTAMAELAESLLTRLCRILGGGSFTRRSPFAFWFEDVRALGFLRPPWGLAFQTLIAEATSCSPNR